MIYTWLILGFLLPLITTLILVPLVRRRALKMDWVDRPDSYRKLHASPTPSVGGLAIAAGAAVGFLYIFFAQSALPFQIHMPPGIVLGSGVAMVVVGFYDDIRGLGFKRKFAIQAFIAFLILHVGYRIEVTELSFLDTDPYNRTLHSMTLSMLWVVGIMNAVNLLDGLDGLAAGVVLIAFSSLAIVYGMQGELGLVLIGLLMIGSLVGFLVYNFNPASIFMGDSGSLFLGFSLAAYTLAGKAHGDPMLAKLIPVVALGLPLLDTFLSIIRRMAAGKPIFAPDHDHLHHRLVRRLSPRGAVLVLYTVAAYFAVAAIVVFVSTPAVRVAVISGTLALAYLGIRSLGYLRVESRLSYLSLVNRTSHEHSAPEGDSMTSAESGDGVSSEQVVLHVNELPSGRRRELSESVA